jgi:hypothetical protein
MGKHELNLIAAQMQQKIITKSHWVLPFLLPSSHQLSNRNLHPHEGDPARKSGIWRREDGRGAAAALGKREEREYGGGGGGGQMLEREGGGGCTRERGLGGGAARVRGLGGATRVRGN